VTGLLVVVVVFVVVWTICPFLWTLSCFVSVQSGEVVKKFFWLPDLCRSLRIRE